MVWDMGCIFLFCMFVFVYGCLIAPIPFVEKVLFSPLDCHDIFVESQLIIYVKVCYVCLFCSTYLYVVLSLIPKYLGYYNFISSFEIR